MGSKERLAGRTSCKGGNSCKSIFEGTSGLLNCISSVEKANYLTEFLSEHFYIKEISACMHVQSAGQAAQNIALSQSIDLLEIDHVNIQVSKQSLTAPGCNNTKINTLVQAIMSIQFTVPDVSALSGNKVINLFERTFSGKIGTQPTKELLIYLENLDNLSNIDHFISLLQN